MNKLPKISKAQSNLPNGGSESPILTEAERHKLLVEWNDTQTQYPRDMCIHQLFEEQVKLTPAYHLYYGGGAADLGDSSSIRSMINERTLRVKHE